MNRKIICIGGITIDRKLTSTHKLQSHTRIHSISDCIKAGQLLLDKGVRNCIISLGKSGYVIVNEAIQKHFPAFLINPVVDVSGARDAFLAGKFSMN